MKIPSVLLTALLAGSAFSAPIAKPNVVDGSLAVRDQPVNASPDAAIDTSLEKRMPMDRPSSSKPSSKKKAKKPATFQADDGNQYRTGDTDPSTGLPYAVYPVLGPDGNMNAMQEKQLTAAMGGFWPEDGTVTPVDKKQASKHRTKAGMPQRRKQGYENAEDVPIASVAAGGSNNRGTYTGYKRAQDQQGGLLPKNLEKGQKHIARFANTGLPTDDYGQFMQGQVDTANNALNPNHPMPPGMHSGTDPYMSRGAPAVPDGQGGWDAMSQNRAARNSPDPLYPPDEAYPEY